MIGSAANATSSHGETKAREPSASIGYDFSLSARSRGERVGARWVAPIQLRGRVHLTLPVVGATGPLHLPPTGEEGTSPAFSLSIISRRSISPPPVGREGGVQRQQGEVRRTISAMEAEAPAECRRDRSEPFAVTPEPLGISFADALDAADHDLIPLLYTFKTHAPVEWQVFLRRVDDLQQMALQPRRGETGDCAVDRFGRRQEIPDEYELCRARQRLEGGQAGTIGLIAADQLGDPRQCNPSADRGHAAAEHGEALAAANEEARQRKEKQLGTVALVWPLGARHVIGRSVIHRRRGVPPQPYALRRLPFGFADIKPLRLGTLAPVDAGRRVARFILAELPEGLPLADAPASVHALSDGDGNPLGRDEERRQHGRGLLRPVAQPGGACRESAR